MTSATTFEIIGMDNIIILEKNTGKVYRVVNGRNVKPNTTGYKCC